MRAYYIRFSLRITSFRPDHFSSTAQTLISTRPSGKAASRTVSSVISVGNFAAFLYQETQKEPFDFRCLRLSKSSEKISSQLLVKRWIISKPLPISSFGQGGLPGSPIILILFGIGA